MSLIFVGGNSRNVGKTSVMTGIIEHLSLLDWAAMKITQFGHGICSLNGEICGCEVDEHQYAFTREKNSSAHTDTSRYLAAGAKDSFWLRTKMGELVTALPKIRSLIEQYENLIIETNSLRRFIKPDLYLQVIDPQIADLKPSAQQYFDLADLYLIVSEKTLFGNREDWKLPYMPAQIEIKPHFLIKKNDRYISAAVIDYIESYLRENNLRGCSKLR